MVLAMGAHTPVLSVAWIRFSAVIWTCDLYFGKAAAPVYEPQPAWAVNNLFEFALLGWWILLVGIFLARLWSFHLWNDSTDGILATILRGLPASLLDIEAHAQPDMGAMIAATVVLVLSFGPFVLLRARSADPSMGAARRALVVGVVGVVANVFPRIGVFALPLCAVATQAAGRRNIGTDSSRS